MHDHSKLRAFEMSDEAALWVYWVTIEFPKKKLYCLTSQIKIIETEKVLNGLI